MDIYAGSISFDIFDIKSFINEIKLNFIHE